jgi:hypothetical protein
MSEKGFFCPICNTQIVLGDLERSFIDSLNGADALLGGSSFYRRGSGIKRVCSNCQSNLIFDWKSQAFQKLATMQNLFLDNFLAFWGYKRARSAGRRGGFIKWIKSKFTKQ